MDHKLDIAPMSKPKVACATTSVPKAGKYYFGLSANGSYAAARRGEIPTIKVGRLLRVPIRAMEAKLAVSPEIENRSDENSREADPEDLRRLL
jgi:hypothetical protein